jgi:DNA-binding winged helix-turn-helix (wHTH) protein
LVFVSATHKLLRFGVFELNLDSEELRKSGTLIKLAPQPFRLLALLASHAGLVVTREQIKEKLWGEETYVDFEQGMNHCIKQIRTVLNDNADHPLYVETLPRRGYRFVAPVVSKNVPAPAANIIKSLSGIQSDSLLRRTLEEARSAPAGREATPDAKVMVTRSEPEPTNAIPAYSPTAVGRADGPASADKVTSATAAAEALAPEIARLRKSPSRSRRVLVWAVVLLALLVAAALYWQLHRL